MAAHLFHMRWQVGQFEQFKDHMLPGDVMMVLDFARNLELIPMDEPQSHMWLRKVVTLHGQVCFYKCPRCRANVTDEILCMTKDRKHDFYAVHNFEEVSIQKLRDNGVPVCRLIEFTDNCCSQYKSLNTFGLMASLADGLPRARHYFCVGHGKGPVDALFGRIKRLLNNAIIARRVEVNNVQELYEYCQKTFATPIDNNVCQHYITRFILVDEIDRSFDIPKFEIPGSRKIHCVVTTDSRDVLATRLTSCLCR
jgi:hypothetical protein